MRARLLVGLLVIASPAQAQIFWSQPNVTSAAVAQGFTYKVYVTSPGVTTQSTATLTMVTCSTTDTGSPVTASCQAPVTQVSSIGATVPGASSQVTATDTVNNSAESAKSAPFVMSGCANPANVSLTVGSWARTLPTGGVGQVLYSLLQSKSDVTMVSVLFNGVEQGRLNGARLNDVAGSYFTATVPAGTYQLTVQATDVNGCTAGGATRPMTVVVQ